MQPRKFKKPKLTRKNLLITGVTLVGVAIFAIVIVDYISTRAELKRVKIEQGANDEITKLVKEVSKFIELPAAETPTVATVNDTEVLKDQLFFEKAQKDDKVIVYQQFGRAILYRPSEKKIIEYSVVNYN